MMADWFDKLLNWHVAAWAAFWLNAVAIFKIYNERQRDVHSERAADWDRIRSERDVAREERDLVRDKLAESETGRIEWMGRAIKAEATLQGWSEARQRLAIEDAEKRLAGKAITGNGGG